jgi:D-serine deaminase-like pyridoxal phosphate-dependent protein
MGGDFEYRVSVLTTVISRWADRSIVDAGTKLWAHPPWPRSPATIPPVMRIGEEHEISVASPDAGTGVGDVAESRVRCAPDPANRSDSYHIVEDKWAVDIWPFIPTGPGQGGMLA